MWWTQGGNVTQGISRGLHSHQGGGGVTFMLNVYGI